MAIEFAAEPAGCRAAFESGLLNLMESGTPKAYKRVLEVKGGSAPPPLPVYMLANGDESLDRIFTDAKLTGWYYLIVMGGNPVQTALVVPDPKAPTGFLFVSLSTDSVVEIVKAIAVAESKLGELKNRLELRLLRVPSMYLQAVWLHNPKMDSDDYIVIISSPIDSAKEGLVLSRRAFHDLLIRWLELDRKTRKAQL
jgi:hypothetical protein